MAGGMAADALPQIIPLLKDKKIRNWALIALFGSALMPALTIILMLILQWNLEHIRIYKDHNGKTRIEMISDRQAFDVNDDRVGIAPPVLSTILSVINAGTESGQILSAALGSAIANLPGAITQATNLSPLSGISVAQALPSAIGTATKQISQIAPLPVSTQANLQLAQILPMLLSNPLLRPILGGLTGGKV